MYAFTFYDYLDLDRLERHMLEPAPEDAAEIKAYVKGIRSFVGVDLMGRMVLGGLPGALPAVLRNVRRMKTPLSEYAQRFQNPLLRRALPLVEYSIPSMPTAVHFAKHASGTWGDIRWPAGASGALSASMADRYQRLGGALRLGKRVEKILTEGSRAVGVRLTDGSEHFADTIISNADGRKTIYGLLDGRFKNETIDAWAKPPENDETNWGTMVYLGVDRDLSKEPSSLVLLLDEPAVLTGLPAESLEMQIYGYDPGMAPAGKGVIKVELVTRYAYWQDLSPAAYDQRKRETVDQVLGILACRYPGIESQVEAWDVVTLRTWERFMGGTRGFANGPTKPFGFGAMLKKAPNTLPGLDRFYMAGIWVTGMGALFANAASGKRVVQDMVRRDGRAFRAE